jgi:putative peptidoglycan lipid II flippase
MFDRQFLNYFASVREGGITLIGTAKDLFNAPFNVIGPAAGAASLPFFASLFQQKKFDEFSHSVTRSVSRLFAVAMLVSAWMIALAPWLMDLFRGGRFNRADSTATTQLFIVLSITLGIWSVQGIYARAFYAASDTMTPAISGTIITVASVPIYWLLFRTQGLLGLAIASDIGITIQTATLAYLLHRKGRVLFHHLEWPELTRSLIAALVAFAATYGLVHLLRPTNTHTGDLITITAGSLAWLIAAFAVLTLTGSKLPAQIPRRS